MHSLQFPSVHGMRMIKQVIILHSYLIEQRLFIFDLINNFNTMSQEDIANKTNHYFLKLAGEHPKNEGIDQVLKEAELQIQSNIQGGLIKVANEKDSHKKMDLIDQLLKKKEINPFESRYQRFLLNSDREKSHERYEIFKKIKQQYSKQKTAIVVKSVENKIKQWTTKKVEIDRRKQRSNERKKQIEIEILQELKRKQLEKQELQAFRKKEEMMKRLQILEKRREERDELLKQSSIRTKEIKLPKYKEIEQKFSQLEERLKQEQEKLLESKKRSMTIDKDKLKEHLQKYQSLRKEKEEERKKKIKYDLNRSQSIEERDEFCIVADDHLQQKKEDAEKRKRRKEFQEKVKSMVLLPKKEHKQQNAEQHSFKPEQLQNSQLHIKKRIRRSERQLNTSADPRKLGNDYLKQLKQKDRDILGKSVSLPKINAHEVSTRPAYKNYLTEVKLNIKRKGVGDEIAEVKRRSKSKVEVYQQLSKKSSSYEQNMIKKIKQLGKIDKYNDSVQKEKEIDDLHARYIKMRLACIDV